MDSRCGVGVAVGRAVGVEVLVEGVVGTGEEVDQGEAGGAGVDAALVIPHALRIKDRMIEDSIGNLNLFILSF